jgi:transposase
MIGLPSGTRIWLATGVTDMRRGFDGLASIVQEKLAADPFAGHVFVFRGRRGDLVKLLWWDGDGLCLFAKRLERGRFIWPKASEGSIHLSALSFQCSLKASTGAAPVAPGNRNGRPKTALISHGRRDCSPVDDSRKLSA